MKIEIGALKIVAGVGYTTERSVGTQARKFRMFKVELRGGLDTAGKSGFNIIQPTIIQGRRSEAEVA